MVSDAPALTKRERLELILQKEKEKDRLENKKHVKHTPAQYRKLLLSTSNRTIGTTKEANKKPVVKKSATPTSLRVVSSAENKKRGKMETVKSLLFDAPDGYQSVFQGKRPSKTAVAMRTAKEKSAWAKIAQFEQDMYSLQVKAEKLAKLKTIKEQRKYLDVQVEEREKFAELEAAKDAEIEALRDKCIAMQQQNDKLLKDVKHFMSEGAAALRGSATVGQSTIGNVFDAVETNLQILMADFGELVDERLRGCDRRPPARRHEEVRVAPPVGGTQHLRRRDGRARAARGAGGHFVLCSPLAWVYAQARATVASPHIQDHLVLSC